MLRFLIHRPKWLVVVAGILFFMLAQSDWLTGSHLWQRAEGALTDRLYQLRSQLLRRENLPDTNIKLIGLGSTSFQLDALAPEEIAASPTLQKMQQPWPWDRSVYAAILEKLMNAGAKVVMFDFVFASETEGDPVFAAALKKYQDRVVIGEMTANEQGATGQTKKLTQPNTSLVSPGQDSLVGLVDIWTDSDDVVRRARYRTSVDRESLDSQDLDPRIFSVLKTRIDSGKSPDDLVQITARVAEKFRGKIFTPPPEQKTFINFQGPAGTYRAWPVENMFVDSLWRAKPFEGGLAVSNKIVIVGPMAEIFHDVHATPFGEMPGPEIQAQMLAALLHGVWITETSPTVNFSLALGAVILALLICLGIPQALLKGLLLAGVTVAFLAACQICFNYYNLMIAIPTPLFCLVTTGSFGIIFEYTLEQLERRRYRNLFGRYVSKNVAKMILDDRRSAANSLLGIKKPVTILFSDIRGFTTMTENTDANKLVAQLNEYFGKMVTIIQQQNEGTLQKFIGDAIMAAWGDTHSHGDAEDARRAVNAALAMRRGLVKLNERWKQNPDRLQLAIGIGVNHGEVVYGNIGSKDRMELTVLGDGVNLAARLESATKQFHTDILVGEQAEKLTRDHFVYRTVDLLTVKGKTKPVEVFSILSDHSQPPPGWLITYEVAVKLYRNREFREAADRFEFAKEELGGSDFLCEMYLSRCATYQKNPPPKHWDGSFTLAEK